MSCQVKYVLPRAANIWVRTKALMASRASTAQMRAGSVMMPPADAGYSRHGEPYQSRPSEGEED